MAKDAKATPTKDAKATPAKDAKATPAEPIGMIGKIKNVLMASAGAVWLPWVLGAFCAINVFTIILGPTIVPTMVAAHTARPNAKWVVTTFTAAGAAIGAMALHAGVTYLGQETLALYLPEAVMRPNENVANILNQWGPIGVGVAAFVPGPMQPAVILAAVMNWNILSVGACIFAARLVKNFFLVEASARALQVSAAGAAAAAGAAQAAGAKKQD